MMRTGISLATEPSARSAERVAITPSRELRDEIINSGMEAGMQEQMQLLEQVARSLT
jgi:hypothetical protein